MKDYKEHLQNMIKLYESIAKIAPALLKEEKYIEAKISLSTGGVCPVCGCSESYTRDGMELGVSNCYVQRECKNCNTIYQDHYKYYSTKKISD